MIGLIQKTLIELVERKGGRAAVEAICSSAGVNPRTLYFSNMDYSDRECLAMMDAARHFFGLSEEGLYQVYGRFFLDRVKSTFPRFFEQATTAREFLELQPRIHAAFATGKADPTDLTKVSKKFEVVDDGSDDLVLNYRSPNALCGLYVALARELFSDFGEDGDVVHELCSHHGADHCRIRIRFAGEQRLSPLRMAAAG